MHIFNPLLGVVIVALVLAAGWVIATTNRFKRLDIRVAESRSGIEVALTKRYDTLLKMRDVARGYAAHERALFADVTRLRTGASVTEMSQASSAMDGLARAINVVAENYPQLASAAIFTQLQAAVADTEQHLQAARRVYNTSVTAYNTAIVMFPASLLAAGRTGHEFFETDEQHHADVPMDFAA